MRGGGGLCSLCFTRHLVEAALLSIFGDASYHGNLLVQLSWSLELLFCWILLKKQPLQPCRKPPPPQGIMEPIRILLKEDLNWYLTLQILTWNTVFSSDTQIWKTPVRNTNGTCHLSSLANLSTAPLPRSHGKATSTYKCVMYHSRLLSSIWKRTLGLGLTTGTQV